MATRLSVLTSAPTAIGIPIVQDSRVFAISLTKEEADLDFVALTDHAEDISPGEWLDTLRVARQVEGGGRVMPFVGFELAGANPAVNLVFPELDGVVLAEDLFKGQGRDLPDDSMVVRDDIWPRLSRYSPIGLVAHPDRLDFLKLVGRHELEALVGVEFYSTGGRTHEPCSGGQPGTCNTYDNSVGAAGNGYLLAAVGGGNNHFALPGRDGVVGVLARGRGRADVVEALRSRRTIAARSERIRIAFAINGHLMGSDVQEESNDGDCDLKLTVSSAADKRPIRAVVVARVDIKPEQEIGVDRARLEATFDTSLAIGETGTYLARVLLDGINEAQAVTSPIRVHCVK